MPRSLKVRQPKVAEVRRLQALLEDAPAARQGRRAEAVLLYATGMEAVEIAQVLAAHPNTVYADLHAFDRAGLASLQPLGVSADAGGLTPERVRDICRLADTAPYELGLPSGRWSLSKLRDYLLKERVCRHLSREHLRRLLRKGGGTCGASSAKSSAMTRNGARC